MAKRLCRVIKLVGFIDGTTNPVNILCGGDIRDGRCNIMASARCKCGRLAVKCIQHGWRHEQRAWQEV